jgi:hypothetical protein
VLFPAFDQTGDTLEGYDETPLAPLAGVGSRRAKPGSAAA